MNGIAPATKAMQALCLAGMFAATTGQQALAEEDGGRLEARHRHLEPEPLTTPPRGARSEAGGASG